MRNLSVVTLGLIAGILSSSTALGPGFMNGISEADIRNVPGITDTFILILKSANVVKSFRNDCHKYGSSQSYEIFEKSVASFISKAIPIGDNITTVSHMGERRPSPSADPLSTFVDRFCPTMPQIKTAIRELMNSYKNCLEPESRDRIDSEGGVLIPLLEYACESRGTHIQEVLNNVRDECVQIAGPEIIDCMNKTDLLKGVKESAIKWGINLLTSDLSLEDCRLIEKTRSCVLGGFNKCHESKVKDVADRAFEIIGQHTPCANLPNGKLSSTSAAGINGVPAVTILMAIFVTLKQLA